LEEEKEKEEEKKEEKSGKNRNCTPCISFYLSPRLPPFAAVTEMNHYYASHLNSAAAAALTFNSKVKSHRISCIAPRRMGWCPLSPENARNARYKSSKNF
jgi:hypothetical protein